MDIGESTQVIKECAYGVIHMTILSNTKLLFFCLNILNRDPTGVSRHMLETPIQQSASKLQAEEG